MGVPVHGGDPHVILGVSNDPLFEAFMGLQPEPPEEEPDWDEAARSALMFIE